MRALDLAFKVVQPTSQIQKDMPLWHHPGEDPEKRQVNNGIRARCLRGTHRALSVGEGVVVASRLEDPLHSKSATCPCDACDADRDKECGNPSACAESADSRLKQLLLEWDPRRSGDPAQHHLEGAGENRPPDEEGEAVFYAPDGPTHLSQGLRILTQ
ncbi:hypothetical protein C8R45DRAFT_837708, partial [Mycena sanguinolenta]